MNTLRCLRFPGREPCSLSVVLLPAAYSGPEDAVAAGFPAALHARFPQASLLLPELPVDDLQNRSGLVALRREIVDPARASTRVWLAGISLGGYLSLLYARQWAQDLAGLLLLAPYLGNRGLGRAIQVAGGPRAWLADPAALDPAVGTEEERGVWRLLAEERRLPVRMGYGDDDRFAGNHRLAAQLLPPTDVSVVPGGHDWRTWLDIWNHLLPCIDP